MLITYDYTPLLAGLTRKQLEIAFELAEEYDATSVRIDDCGTIEFVFDRVEYYEPSTTMVDVTGKLPEPFVPTACTISEDLRCEEDNTENS